MAAFLCAAPEGAVMPERVHVQVHESKSHLVIKWITVLGILLIAFLTWQSLTREPATQPTPTEQISN